MKKFLLLPLLLLLPFLLKAQDFTIPNYKTKEDYSIHQEGVLQAIEWLKTHPLDHVKRKQANAYVLKWAEGSPNVSVGIRGYVMDLAGKNPDFLLLFIGGWIQYALEHPDTYTADEASHQAVVTVVEYYMAGNGAQKDAKLEKIVRQYKKGSLKEWIAKQA